LDWAMHDKKKSVLLVAMPFAGITIPSIQLPVLEGYCHERGITIETRHLYLKAAELYGLQNYHYLIYPPNDSYTAQMVFSRYVFPDHWKNNKNKFQEFFHQHSVQNSDIPQFSFDEYVHRTDIFYQWILDHADWRFFDIIGFTLNYGQLLPSLAIAKKIKELTPDKKVVFGGSRTAGMLGRNVLHAFEYVDFIVSGEGENALFLLASDYENYKSIPQLMYRNRDQVIWNNSDVVIDLNTIPIPSYDQFYKDLASTSVDVQKYYQYYGRLPIEISRGCWWNRCTFCNLNIQHRCYREKSINRILQEIQRLSERYRMMDFQLIGNTLPKTEYRILFEKLKNLGRDFSFFVEARAGQLTSDDYKLMKEAGFTMIQTGIESFSQNYLRKMNKGVRVIDNIAVLKFCKENGIKNNYNLLVKYPNEESVDFNETKKIVQILKGYLDAPQLCELRVMHGSPLQRNPEHFNIERLEPILIDRIMYPLEFLKKEFSFTYDFNRKIPSTDYPWESLVEEWKKERKIFELDGINRQTTVDRLVYYFVDGGSFIKIFDKRDQQNIRIVMLNELERAVFLACVDVVSLQQLQQRFTNIPEFELIAMLQSFEQNGLMFVEDERYLSLPLRFSVDKHPAIRTECQMNVSL
jgi:ribosomal peptide maturation radical SAM protein 1